MFEVYGELVFCSPVPVKPVVESAGNSTDAIPEPESLAASVIVNVPVELGL